MTVGYMTFLNGMVTDKLTNGYRQTNIETAFAVGKGSAMELRERARFGLVTRGKRLETHGHLVIVMWIAAFKWNNSARPALAIGLYCMASAESRYGRPSRNVGEALTHWHH